MAENSIETLTVGIDLDSANFSLACKKVGEDLKRAAEEAKEAAEKIKEHGEKAGEFFNKLKEHAIEFFGIMATAGAFIAFTERTIKSGTAMNHLSEETKMSIEDISLWQNAAVIAGGSAEGFSQSLKGMGESLVAIEKGLPRAQRAIKAFEAAGIHGLGKGKHVEITAMYDKIHEKFQGLSMAEAQTLGKRMQLDEATIRVLHKSGEEYDEFMKKAREAGIVTKEHAEQAEKAEEAMNTFKITMQRASEVLINNVIPYVTKLAEGLTHVVHWASDHSSVIKAALAGIAAVLIFMNIQTIIAIPAALAMWATELAGAIATQAAFWGVATSASAMWTAVTWPVALVIAAFIAVAVGVIYLYHHFEGFRRVADATFRFVKEYALAFLSGLKGMFQSVFGYIEGAFTILVGIFTGNWDKIRDGAHEMLSSVVEFFRLSLALMLLPVLATTVIIKQVFVGLFSGLLAPAQAFFGWIEDKFKLVAKVVKGIASLFSTKSDSGEQNPRGADRIAESFHDAAPSGFQLAYAGGYHDQAPSGFGRQAPTSKPLPAIHPSVINAHAIAAVHPASISSAVNNAKSSAIHSETHIGEVTIVTQSTDPKAAADAFKEMQATDRRLLSDHADTGLS
jgi:hypothetical protein